MALAASDVPDVLLQHRHSRAGFYHATLSKGLLAWLGLSHVATHVPMFSAAHKYLVCNISDSLRKGEFWRLFTCKLAFLDPKDALMAAVLVYYFRVFERRYGSRKFFSHLSASFLLASLFELAISFGLTKAWPHHNTFNGLLAIGPFHAILPWFVPFYLDIPKVPSRPSDRGGGGGGGLGLGLMSLFVSPKMWAYFAGMHIFINSPANLVTGVACLLSGFLVRANFLWLQNWCCVPKRLASLAQTLVGQWVESGPPLQGMIGATLEVQRAQQAEVYEQQLIRQQARFAANRNRMPQVGQGFAERLVGEADRLGGGGGGLGERRPWGAAMFPRPRNDAGAPGPAGAEAGAGADLGADAVADAVVPDEAQIRLLTDMGFSRERAENALRQTGNDVTSATAILLHEM